MSTPDGAETQLRHAVGRVISLALARERKGKRRASPSPAESLPTPDPTPKKKRRTAIQRRSESPSPVVRVKNEPLPSPVARVKNEPLPFAAQEPIRERGINALADERPSSRPVEVEDDLPAPPVTPPHPVAQRQALAQRHRHLVLERQLAESRAQVSALTRIALVDYDVAESVVYQMRGVLSGMMARIRRERELVEGVVEDAGM